MFWSVIVTSPTGGMGLLALVAATMTIGACSLTEGEEQSNAPPASTVTHTSPLGPSRAPSTTDVPAKYVLATWQGSLWGPTPHSSCVNRLPQKLRPRPQGGRRFIYFSCVTTGSAPLAAAARTLRNERSIEEVLKLLFEGPTAAERRAGYRATFGAGTAHLPFTVRVDKRYRLAIIDLDRRFLEVEFLFVPTQDVAQIVSTAGQFPGIEWVAILIGGQPLCKALREC